MPRSYGSITRDFNKSVGQRSLEGGCEVGEARFAELRSAWPLPAIQAKTPSRANGLAVRARFHCYRQLSRATLPFNRCMLLPARTRPDGTRRTAGRFVEASACPWRRLSSAPDRQFRRRRYCPAHRDSLADFFRPLRPKRAPSCPPHPCKSDANPSSLPCSLARRSPA